jgi:hypothetical protein
MPALESIVSKRDELSRIKKMITRPIDGTGPAIETTVVRRDENGSIARMTHTLVDTAPLPPAIEHDPRQYRDGEPR